VGRRAFAKDRQSERPLGDVKVTGDLLSSSGQKVLLRREKGGGGESFGTGGLSGSRGEENARKNHNKTENFVKKKIGRLARQHQQNHSGRKKGLVRKGGVARGGGGTGRRGGPSIGMDSSLLHDRQKKKRVGLTEAGGTRLPQRGKRRNPQEAQRPDWGKKKGGRQHGGLLSVRNTSTREDTCSTGKGGGGSTDVGSGLLSSKETSRKERCRS